MSDSHKVSNLSLQGQLISVDNNTVFLAHYDNTKNDVLRGLEPTGEVSTLRPFEGKFGGGVAVESNTTNIIINPSVPYTTQSNIGWDNSLNGTYKPTAIWSSGYNSGVTSANVGYHAHVNVDRFGYPVFEFVDKNGQFGSGLKHRWLGISQLFASNVSSELGWADGTKVSLSFDMMTDHVDKGIQTGLYHRTSGDTGNTFGTTSATSFISKPFEWERIERTITLVGSEWDFTKNSYVYIYGNHYRNDYEGTAWIKNVQIETKSYSTSYVEGSRALGFMKYPLIVEPNNVTINFWSNNKESGGFYIDIMCGSDSNRLFLRPSTSTSIDGGKVINGTVKLVGETNIGTMIGQWRMYTIVSEGSNVKMYVDGKKVKENLTIGTISGMSTSLDLNGVSRGVRNCIYDELRVDNIARTDEEIESWFISQKPFYPRGIYRIAY
jgi:hypothetical protein